jgi:hypothetical protein
MQEYASEVATAMAETVTTPVAAAFSYAAPSNAQIAEHSSLAELGDEEEEEDEDETNDADRASYDELDEGIDDPYSRLTQTDRSSTYSTFFRFDNPMASSTVYKHVYLSSFFFKTPSCLSV